MGGGARTTAHGVMASLRIAEPSDLAGVVAIERSSFGDPWTRAMLAAHLKSEGGNNFLVADTNGRVAGYAITVAVAEECELLNIAVDPDFRGQGIGAALLDSAMARCQRSGATEIWLEVRASNAAARALYASRGFTEQGVRKRYYHAPREDALVLRADLRTFVGSELVTEVASGFPAGVREPILSSASHFPRQENK